MSAVGGTFGKYVNSLSSAFNISEPLLTSSVNSTFCSMPVILCHSCFLVPLILMPLLLDGNKAPFCTAFPVPACKKENK